MRLFSAADERRISEAIANAERQTSGEIVVVVAAQSDGYHYVPPLVAAIVSLLVPWVLIYFTQLDIVRSISSSSPCSSWSPRLLMPAPIRTALVPGGIKRLHAHRRAVEQFLAQNLHTTAGRTGVLLFVSVAERHAADHRRQGDRREGGARARGRTSSTTSPPPSAAGTRPTASSRPSPPSAPSSPSISRPAPRIPNELPDHLIILQ